ncbi:protealysin inhibitor emfourin [Pseudomonas syringae]|nr:hypothetical protein [Pseudomonas syringae]
MKVCVVQSGGFAGVIHQYQVDADTLHQAQAEQLKALVQRLDLPGSGQWLDEQSADLKLYEVTVEHQGETVCLIFDEHNIPATVRPLLRFLQEYAARSPTGKGKHTP